MSRRVRRVAGRRYNWRQWVVLIWVAAWSIAVGWLITDRLTEDDRRAAAARQAAVAFCAKTRGEALAPVPSAATEFARNLVRGAVFAYQLAQCDQYVPQLQVSEVDPDAFRAAPTPTATPSPTR